MTTTGHCLCRAVRFEFDGAPNATFHCHCESCRRTTSSPVTTWLNVSKSAFRFTRGKPAIYVSSPGVRRGFCAACGSPLIYENAKDPDTVDLYAASPERSHGRDTHPARLHPRTIALVRGARHVTPLRDDHAQRRSTNQEWRAEWVEIIELRPACPPGIIHVRSPVPRRTPNIDAALQLAICRSICVLPEPCGAGEPCA